MRKRLLSLVSIMLAALILALSLTSCSLTEANANRENTLPNNFRHTSGGKISYDAETYNGSGVDRFLLPIVSITAKESPTSTSSSRGSGVIYQLDKSTGSAYIITNHHVVHLTDGEICADIKEQYENGVATCALFMIKLVPEGDPAYDKAAIEGEKFKLFRDRLSAMGIRAGILAQCTIGHGYPLDHPFGFQSYINLKDGEKDNVVCPYDEAAREHFKAQFATLAALSPEVIMVDDDFRLMYRQGMGCVCPLHMAALEKSLGYKLSREELRAILKNKRHPDYRKTHDAYVETQRDALLGMAKFYRAGIDTVDEAMPGIFCSVGPTTEFGAEIGKILAGRGNPTVVRLNNGNYTPEGAHYLSSISYRAAQQSHVLRTGGVDVILAETDTCPHNRYSTGVQSLHSHFTVSILEGVAGAKHWITRLDDQFEPRSGVAYRKKLSKYRGFYQTLSDLAPTLRWEGCRIPLPKEPDYGFTNDCWMTTKGAWHSCVLERLGLPIYFSAEDGGATFLEGSTELFSKEELVGMCEGTLFVASDAAAELCEMGLGDALGVTVLPWEGERASFERLPNGNRCAAQLRVHELRPDKEGVRDDSTVYHLKDATEEIPLFPGVAVYKKPNGKLSVTFSGSPRAEFVYYEAFSFLNESRKAQMVALLRESGNLPVYFVGDEEVYLKSATLPTEERFLALFNLGLDPIDEITLDSETPVTSVEYLDADGKRMEAPFRMENGRIVVSRPLVTLEPVILFLR